MNPNARGTVILAFVLILIIASFFRLYKLADVPPGLYIDVAANGNNALEALRTGDFKTFYQENNGREGLFINLQALAILLWGNTPFSLKIVSALFGILTVLGMYFLTRELFSGYEIRNGHETTKPFSYIRKEFVFRSEYTALLAALFVAVSFWHINFSRIGFRAISAPFFLVFGFYFLLKTFHNLHTRRHLLFAIGSGIAFGLGFHTYIGYRVLPLLLAVIFLWEWRNIKAESRRSFLWAISYLLFATFLAALPLGLYFLSQPQDFLGRATDVAVWNKPAKDGLLNIVKTFGMFNVIGDWNWRHNFAGKPILEYPVGIFFLMGFFLSFRETFRERPLKLTPYSFSLAWFFIMLLPNLLSPEGTPHALRALVTLPAVFILVGIGAVWLGGELKSLFLKLPLSDKHLLWPSLILTFLILLTNSVFETYFFRWGRNPAVIDTFSANYLEEAETLNQLSPEISKYVIINMGGVDIRGFPASAQTAMYIIGSPNQALWQSKNIAFIKESDFNATNFQKPAFLLSLQEKEETKEKILRRFPEAQIIKFKYFTGYRI